MLRQWREAASLIIAARSKVTPDAGRTSSDNCKIATGGPSDREQADDMSLLCLKRSQRSSEFASAYVFPGGVVDKVDFSSRWLQVFEQRGQLSDLQSLKQRTGEPRPPVLQSSTYDWLLGRTGGVEHRSTASRDDQFSLPPEVALRLTAIRETFEECGLLLVRPNDKQLDDRPTTIEIEDVVDWQKRVQKDPSELINLFLQLRCCPDVWALHEWSSWLAPTFQKHRFDTLFFISMLDEEPLVHCSFSEVTDFKWCLPSQLLNLYSGSHIDLPPPQLYEILHLQQFADFNQLCHFVEQKRPVVQLPFLFPVGVQVKDGIVILYPGDELYPHDPILCKTSSDIGLKYNSTMLDLEKSSRRLNRLCFGNDNSLQVLCNLRDDRRGTKAINWKCQFKESLYNHSSFQTFKMLMD